MAVGLASTGFLDKVLNHMLRATASTAPATNYVAPHTADPGAAGTTSACTGSGATRVIVAFAAPTTVTTTRSCSMTGTAPSWAAWTGGSVTISHISVWDLITAGVFLYSAALTTPKAITGGDTFTLSSLDVAIGPVAA